MERKPYTAVAGGSLRTVCDRIDAATARMAGIARRTNLVVLDRILCVMAAGPDLSAAREAKGLAGQIADAAERVLRRAPCPSDPVTGGGGGHS